MAERKQACVAQKQVEPERRDGRDEAVGERDCLKRIDHQWRDKKQQRDWNDPGEGPHGRADVGEDGAHAQARPNRPAGRTSSTPAAIR